MPPNACDPIQEQEQGCKAGEHHPELKIPRQRHRRLKGVFLVHDGGPSHIAAATAGYLGSHGPWWRPRLTPAHASWLIPLLSSLHPWTEP